MADYRQKIRQLVKTINQNYIAEIPRNIFNPELGPETIFENPDTRDQFMPITTTMLLLNTCLGNNTLIEGGSGAAKTKLASVAGSLLFQMPYEFFSRKRVAGTPGATINEIYATHDLAELNRGNDVAFLYLSFHSPFVIIDELNRFSELEQNRIREGVSEDTWSYASHSWIKPNQIVVSAMNPESYKGTFGLNDNLIDNYSVFLEPAHYNMAIHKEQVIAAEARIEKDLGLEGEVNKLLKFFQEHKNDEDLISAEIAKLQERTFKEYEDRGIPVIHNGFINEIKKEVEKLKFNSEANLFLLSTNAEMTTSEKYGRLRFDDPISDDSHDIKYLSTSLKEGLAGRFLKDWTQISKALAWYMGDDRVRVEHVKSAFIYTAPKRLKVEEEVFQRVLNDSRKLPYNIQLAKNLIENSWNTYSGFANSKNIAFQHIRKAVRILNGKHDQEANKEEVAEGIKLLQLADHPIAKCLLEAIAIQDLDSQT